MTVKAAGRGFDPEDMNYLNLYFNFFVMVSKQNVALSSATQQCQTGILEFRGKWGTECLTYTRFPLPTLLFAGYSVKLILLFYL